MFCGRGVEQGTHKLVGESNGIGSSVLVVFVLHLLCNGAVAIIGTLALVVDIEAKIQEMHEDKK